MTGVVVIAANAGTSMLVIVKNAALTIIT